MKDYYWLREYLLSSASLSFLKNLFSFIEVSLMLCGQYNGPGTNEGLEANEYYIIACKASAKRWFCFVVRRIIVFQQCSGVVNQ